VLPPPPRRLQGPGCLPPSGRLRCRAFPTAVGLDWWVLCGVDRLGVVSPGAIALLPTPFNPLTTMLRYSGCPPKPPPARRWRLTGRFAPRSRRGAPFGRASLLLAALLASLRCLRRLYRRAVGPFGSPVRRSVGPATVASLHGACSRHRPLHLHGPGRRRLPSGRRRRPGFRQGRDGALGLGAAAVERLSPRPSTDYRRRRSAAPPGPGDACLDRIPPFPERLPLHPLVASSIR
jgi:hypothetical protein